MDGGMDGGMVELKNGWMNGRMMIFFFFYQFTICVLAMHA